MAESSLTITGLDELRLAIAQLTAPEFLRALVHAGALIIAGKFKKYPRVNRLTRESVYGQTWQSEKQQRYFFWALRAGVIQVPYYRGQNPKSQNLQQSWNVVMLGDTSASVGTAVSYAPLMMDAERQSKYAQAVGWSTVQRIVSDAEPEVKASLEAGLAKTAIRWTS